MREIIVEPARQRGVDIGDGTVGIRGEKACRRVIEKIDRVLQFQKNILVAFAFTCHLGDAPERRVLATHAIDRAHADAIPADRTVTRQGRGEAQLFHAAFAVARRLREAIDSFRHIGRTRKQPLDSAQVRRVLRT